MQNAKSNIQIFTFEISIWHLTFEICNFLVQSTRLCLFVSKQFQVLFHWVSHPSFHLSLTVLVHYRSSEVFSLGEWSPQLPKGVCRLPWYSGTSLVIFEFRIHGFHVLWQPIPRSSAILRPPRWESYNPPHAPHEEIRNPKFEIRNKFKYRNPNDQNKSFEFLNI